MPELSSYSSSSMSSSASSSVNVVSSRSGIYRDPPHQEKKQEQSKANLFDPALLARLADEERRKKMGGGGGVPQFKSPSLFVLYSLRLIAEKMMELYKIFQRSLDSAFPVVLENLSSLNLNQFALKSLKSLGFSSSSIQNFLNNLKPENLVLNLKVAVKTTFKNFIDIFQSILASAFGFANKLFKNKYSKDEDIEEENIKSKEEHPFLTAMKNLFALNR